MMQIAICRTAPYSLPHMAAAVCTAAAAYANDTVAAMYMVAIVRTAATAYTVADVCIYMYIRRPMLSLIHI